jgi:HEAT repeat protein
MLVRFSLPILGLCLVALPMGTALAADADVDQLIGQLTAKEPTVRCKAALKLGEKGALAGSAVDALANCLGDDDALVRAHAARALREIGDVKAVPALMKALTDKENQVRREVVKAIRALHPDPKTIVPQMIKLIESSDPATIIVLLDTLAETGEPNAEFLREALANEKSRYWVLLLVAELGPKAKAVVKDIIPLVSSDQIEVRLQALVALAEIGPDAKAAAPALCKALGDELTGCQTAAAFAIGRIGVTCEKGEAKLKKLAKSDDELLSLVSKWALARVNPDDPKIQKRAVAALAKGLTSGDPGLQVACARGLFELKAPVEMTRPIISAAIGKASPEALEGMADAVAGLGPLVVPRVAKALEDEKLRIPAAKILARIGPDAEEATGALVAALETDDAEFKAEAQMALAMIAPDSPKAIPALIEALADKDSDVQRSAAFAIGKIGPSAKAAVDALKTNIKSEDTDLRAVSIWALLRIEPKNVEIAKMAIPVLIEGLGDDHDFVRIECASSLGNIGPLAGQAVPALKQALEDPNKVVRQEAAKAIKKIAGE